MPAFVHWPGTVTLGGAADTVISTLDVLPSLLRILQRPMPTGRTLDGTLSLADVIQLEQRRRATRATRRGPADAPRLPPLLQRARLRQRLAPHLCARYGRYKAHWITSPGLGGGLLPYTSPTPEATHSPPLVFDVEADPEEAFLKRSRVAAAGPAGGAREAQGGVRVAAHPDGDHEQVGVRVRALLWRRLHAAMRVPARASYCRRELWLVRSFPVCATYCMYTAVRLPRGAPNLHYMESGLRTVRSCNLVRPRLVMWYIIMHRRNISM